MPLERLDWRRAAGSIEGGKIADFVLLSADPGDCIENVRSLVDVYRSGLALKFDATRKGGR